MISTPGLLHDRWFRPASTIAPLLLQALSSLLKQTLRGYFIPPRPEKKGPVEGQLGSAEFVEQRRASLERWLQQLAAHPVIGASDVRTLLMRPLMHVA